MAVAVAVPANDEDTQLIYGTNHQIRTEVTGLLQFNFVGITLEKVLSIKVVLIHFHSLLSTRPESIFILQQH